MNVTSLFFVFPIIKCLKKRLFVESACLGTLTVASTVYHTVSNELTERIDKACITFTNVYSMTHRLGTAGISTIAQILIPKLKLVHITHTVNAMQHVNYNNILPLALSGISYRIATFQNKWTTPTRLLWHGSLSLYISQCIT